MCFLPVRGTVWFCYVVPVLEYYMTVTYAFDSRVMQQHKHAQDASMPSQTDVLDADEEHLLVM